MNHALVAFDLATVTGWAWCGGDALYTGRIDLSGVGLKDANKYGARFSAFTVEATKLLTAVAPQAVYFEDAADSARRTSRVQAELWYGWSACLKGVCYELGIHIEPVNTSTYKTTLGLHGKCGKDEIKAACHALNIPVTDENEADAVAVLNVGLKQHGCDLTQFKWRTASRFFPLDESRQIV